MIVLLCVIAVVVAIIAVIRYNQWQRMSRKGAGLSAAIEASKRVDKMSMASQEKSKKVNAIAAEIFKDMKIFPYSEKYRDEVNKMLVALDKRNKFDKLMQVDDIYIQQCLWSFASVGLAVLATLAASMGLGKPQPMAMLLVLTAPLFFHIPLMNLREEFKESQLNAMSQWLEFYNMYYTQFISLTSNAQLPDVIDNFMPLANSDLAKILSIFKNDLNTHEVETALDRLKQRYPDNTRIHKFVSVAKMRQAGDEGAQDMMKSVQDDYIAEEELAYKVELKFRLRKADVITNVVIYSGLALLFTVMIVGMVT